MLVPVGAACTLTGFWHNFGWVPAKAILEEAGLQENEMGGNPVLARFVLWGDTWNQGLAGGAC